jgi:hypothetical protein
VEERLRAVEEKIIAEEAARKANSKWFVIVGMIVITWLGITSFYQIPTAIEGWLDRQGISDAQKQIAKLKNQAEKDAKSLSEMKYSDCKEIIGVCGEGMFKQPTYLLDRVKFSCPTERPFMNSFRFVRCGELRQPNEGLQIAARCCGMVRENSR